VSTSAHFRAGSYATKQKMQPLTYTLVPRVKGTQVDSSYAKAHRPQCCQSTRQRLHSIVQWMPDRQAILEEAHKYSVFNAVYDVTIGNANLRKRNIR
jgi:hypothetical protein